MLTHLIETQGLFGSLEPKRSILSKWKFGQHCEDLEHQDREVRDPEGALTVVRFFLDNPIPIFLKNSFFFRR